MRSGNADRPEGEAIQQWDGFQRTFVRVCRPTPREALQKWMIILLGVIVGEIGVGWVISVSLYWVLGSVAGTTIAACLWFWRGRVAIDE